ncbi:ADP-ribosyltransferase [Xanthomonas phage BUDD]|nr:ADP-ribosyltransferase [Xanthomonas phage BUDD]
MILQENSFYTDQSGLATLLLDKQRVADIFYINFLGFAGLLKIKDAPALMSYVKGLGKLQLSNMTDTNADWSLAIKLAHDAGIINMVAANMATKFLALVKSGKVRSADIKDDPIRDIIKACRVISNKPSPRIYQAVQDFADAKDQLETTTVKLWKLSARPETVNLAKEFREQITLGGYSSAFLKHQWSAGTATTPAPVAVQQPPAKGQRGSLPPQGAAHGSDSDYMAALLHVFKLKGGIHSYLERFGFKGHFDVDRFKKAVASPEFVLSHGYHVPWEQHPFVQWIRKKDPSASAAVLKILNDKDRQAGAIAVATQVSNTAPPAPKPAAVIQTVVATRQEPVVNNTSISEMYLNGFNPKLSGVMKWHHWPSGEEAAIIKNNLAKVVEALRSFEVDELKKPHGRIEQNEYTQSTFAKLLLSNGVMPSQINGPIYNTLLKSGERKDADAVFNLLIDYNNASTLKQNAFGGGFGNDPVTTAASHLFSGDGVDFILDHLTQIKSAGLEPIFYDAGKHRWIGNDPETEMIRNLIQCLMMPSSTLDGIVRNVEATFARLDIRTGRTIGRNLAVDKESFDNKASAKVKRLVEAVNKIGDVDIALKKFEGDAALLDLLTVAKKITQGPSYAMSDHFISVLGDAKDGKFDIKPAIKNQEDLFLIFKALQQAGFYMNAVSRATAATITPWLYEKMATAGSLNWPLTGTPNQYGEYPFPQATNYFKYLLDKGHTTAAREIAPWMIYFGSDSSIFKLVLANFPELKEDVFKRSGKIGHGGTTFAAILDHKFDATAMSYMHQDALASFVHAISVHGDIEDAVKSARWAREKIMKGEPDRRPWETADSRTVGVLGTAWFVEPSDPHYNEALETVSKWLISTIKNNYSDSTIKLFQAYNPELWKAWIDQKKKGAENSPLTTTSLRGMMDKAEYSELYINCLKGQGLPAIKENLISSTTGWAAQMMQVADSEDITIDAKKELVRKFAPAMEVNGVHTIRDKSHRDSLNKNFADVLLDVYDADKDLADKIFVDLPRTTRTLIVKQQGEMAYVEAIKDDLYKHPIKPDFALDHARIRTILKYNNLAIRVTSNRNIVQTIGDIDKAAKASIGKALVDLKVSEVKQDEKGLELETIRLNKFRNNKHGEVAFKVLKSFDVAFPGSAQRIAAFRKANPQDGTLDPVFHGTGTIAASMVLRNGFQIIPANDSSAVGRMLGNGIYFSNVIDKAQQYVGDKGGGITRSYGTRGYIFEMEAELGKNPKDYRSAGLGRDSIRSPEWAVFDPDNQLRIYKAYYIELVSLNVVKAMAAKHNTKLNESVSGSSFENFMMEAAVDTKATSKFWFMGDSLPKSMTETCEVSEFKPKRNVYTEPSWDGGTIVSIEHSLDIDPVTIAIDDTAKWLFNKPDEVKMFFDLMN